MNQPLIQPTFFHSRLCVKLSTPFFCTSGEHQRSSSGKFFVHGASFSDAPPANFCARSDHQRCPSGNFLSKERSLARPLRQIFVQGASFSEILPAIFCISGEFQRDSSGNIFVRGASFSDAPSGSSGPAGRSTCQTLKIPQNTPTLILPTVSHKPASKPSVNKR